MSDHDSTAKAVAVYRMNPAEDEIRFGDEITEGMWVLAEDPQHRSPYHDDEDQRIRAQRFRRVTRLRLTGRSLVFVGEWVDGYQEVHSYSSDHGWLVKKAAPDEPQVPDSSEEA